MQGMICAAMMSDTACAAWSICANVATSVFFAAGFGISFSNTLVMTPSVPSEPMNKSLQRIARHVLHAFVAGPQNFAIRQHDFEAHDVIARDAVFQAAQAAGIFRHVAADGGNFHRAGIGRIKQPGRVRRIGNRQRRHAGLDEHREIGAIEFEDFVHLHQAQHDAIGDRQTAAAQAGAGAARDDGGFGFIGELQDACYVFRVACEDDAAGHLLHRRGAVERVGDEVLFLGEDIFRADDLVEFGNYVLRRAAL